MAEVIKMPGTVRSVNGIKPDENANVELETKPYLLLKRWKYTTKKTDSWTGGGLVPFQLNKPLDEWGFPEGFPNNIPGYTYQGILMGNPMFAGSLKNVEARPYGCYFVTNSAGAVHFYITLGTKYVHRYGAESEDYFEKPPVAGSIIEFYFLYTKTDYDFDF